MPLAAPDLETFRLAEAELRRVGRERSGLANLGPGALELATSMDRTASFLLVQVPVRLKALFPRDGGSSAHDAGSTSGGRLAAPIAGLEPPGAPIFGTYIITVLAFSAWADVADAPSSSAPVETCPCTHSETFDPTTDVVTIAGNTGTIRTTISINITVNGSRVSLDLKMKVEGEVRDAKTGAILYKIDNEATGHADGDPCPDASGVARAAMAFTGHETHFDSAGATVGPGVSEGFGGDIRMHADDVAKLAGVDLTPTGAFGEPLMRLAAQSVAPAFEKAWRSGLCIAVLIDPAGGDVEKDSVTTVAVKARTRSDGKDVEKSMDVSFSGVKAIDPPASKQKSPASLRLTAGPKDGDQASITAESVSNRGVGKKSVNFFVGGGWKTEGNDPTGMIYKGQKCDSLDGVWRVDGHLDNAPMKTTATWSATIDGKTLVGTVSYTSVTVVTSPVGTITTTFTGTGPVSLVAPNILIPDSLLMTLAPMTVTGTAVALGESETLSVPIPAVSFRWSKGGTCAAP